MKNDYFVFGVVFVASFTLIACQNNTPEQIVDDKLSTTYEQPIALHVQPLTEPVPPARVYQVGKDPFANPYRQKNQESNAQSLGETGKSSADDNSALEHTQNSAANTVQQNTPADVVPTGKKASPDSSRVREKLEFFDLQTLQYKGRIYDNERQIALILDPQGRLHQVQKGSYVGRNHGQIIKIDAYALEIQEMALAADGQYYEQKIMMTLR